MNIRTCSLYAFKIFPEANSLHYWAFNLWDRIILQPRVSRPGLQLRYCSFVGPRVRGPRHVTGAI